MLRVGVRGFAGSQLATCGSTDAIWQWHFELNLLKTRPPVTSTGHKKKRTKKNRSRNRLKFMSNQITACGAWLEKILRQDSHHTIDIKYRKCKNYSRLIFRPKHKFSKFRSCQRRNFRKSGKSDKISQRENWCVVYKYTYRSRPLKKIYLRSRNNLFYLLQKVYKYTSHNIVFEKRNYLHVIISLSIIKQSLYVRIIVLYYCQIYQSLLNSKHIVFLYRFAREAFELENIVASCSTMRKRYADFFALPNSRTSRAPKKGSHGRSS